MRAPRLQAVQRNPVMSTLATVAAIPGPKFVQLLANPTNAYTVLAPINRWAGLRGRGGALLRRHLWVGR